MSEWSQIGKLLLVLGGILMVFGGLFLAFDRVPWIGQLPGDFIFEYDNVTVYIPLATMLLLSIILTIIANLIFR